MEAVAGGLLVGAVDEARLDIAAVGRVDLDEGRVALVPFVEPPAGGLGVEVGDAFGERGRRAGRDEQAKSLDVAAAAGRALAAVVEPEDAEG